MRAAFNGIGSTPQQTTAAILHLPNYTAAHKTSRQPRILIKRNNGHLNALRATVHIDTFKMTDPFNNIDTILLKRIRHFECTYVYGVTYIIINTLPSGHAEMRDYCPMRC